MKDLRIKSMLEQFLSQKQKGFTFMEVLAATLLFTLLTVSLLQATVLAFRAYAVTESHWKQTVDLWNRSNRFMAGQLDGTSSVKPLERARSLDRIILTDESGRKDIQWEVLRGH